MFAAPEGQQLDTPARKAAIAKAIALLKTSDFKPTADRAGIDSVGDPFSENTFADSGRIAYAEAQFDRVIYDQGSRCSRGGAGRRAEDSRARGRDCGVQRRSRGSADPAGDTGAARVPGCVHRAADRLPNARRDRDSDRARDRGRGNGFHPSPHPRGTDRHQHDHADPRLDDRNRRRDRLLALHRHALQAVPARGPSAVRRRGGGGILCRSSRDLRRSDRGDLGVRPRILRPRLRHEARHRRRRSVS